MPSRGSRSGGRVLPAAGAGCALILALSACGSERSSPAANARSGPPPALPSRAAPSSASGPAPAATPIVAASAPVSVLVPAVGIRSPLVRLGLTTEGALGVPADFSRAGWYVGGPRPGDAGPAVIAGHVDSRSGPAVFYRLRELRVGDQIRVGRRDGSEVTFAVTDVRQYPKNAFPTRDVYGAVPNPQLRLITCAGAFDAERSSYRSNLVVFATASPATQLEPRIPSREPDPTDARATAS